MVATQTTFRDAAIGSVSEVLKENDECPRSAVTVNTSHCCIGDDHGIGVKINDYFVDDEIRSSKSSKTRLVFLKFGSVGRTSTGGSRRRASLCLRPWTRQSFSSFGRRVPQRCASHDTNAKTSSDRVGVGGDAIDYGMMRGMGPVHRFRSVQEPKNGMNSKSS